MRKNRNATSVCLSNSKEFDSSLEEKVACFVHKNLLYFYKAEKWYLKLRIDDERPTRTVVHDRAIF